MLCRISNVGNEEMQGALSISRISEISEIPADIFGVRVGSAKVRYSKSPESPKIRHIPSRQFRNRFVANRRVTQLTFRADEKDKHARLV